MNTELKVRWLGRLDRWRKGCHAIRARSQLKSKRKGKGGGASCPCSHHQRCRRCAPIKAWLLYEEAAAVRRRTRSACANTFEAIGCLGVSIAVAGDVTAGLVLVEEAAAPALRELGPAHPATQDAAGQLAWIRELVAEHPPGTRAIGTMAWPPSPELNDECAFVIGFDAAKGRYMYRVRHEGNARTGKPIGVKPHNLIPRQCSAVTAEGLDTAPERNGERGRQCPNFRGNAAHDGAIFSMLDFFPTP